MALLPAAAIVVPTLVGDDGRRTDKVGVVGAAPEALEEALTSTRRPGVTIETSIVDGEDAARAALRDDDLDAAVTGLDAAEGARLVTREDRPEELVAILRQVLTRLNVGERLRSSGLDPAEISAILEEPPIPVDEVAPLQTVREDTSRWPLPVCCSSISCC